MYANQQSSANHANDTSAAATREIPSHMSTLRDAMGELGRLGDALCARLEPVRRTPAPQKVNEPTMPTGAIRSVPQTPMGAALDEMTREIETQIRTLRAALDSLELP